MLFIIFAVLLFLGGTVCFLVAVNSPAGSDARVGWFTGFGATVLGFVILIFACSLHLVPQRQVGIVKNFAGQITGVTGNGVVFTAPWSSIDKVNVGVQREDFALGTDNSAVSSDQQPIYANLTLNYHLDAQTVVNLYKSVGPTWKATLIDSRILQDFKEVTSTFTAQAITTNREALRKETRDRLDTELAKYDIIVDDFFVKNIDYNDKYKDAISAKNIQQQASLQAKAKVEQSKYEADQAIQDARGRAQSAIVEAQGEAKSIALRGKALERYPSILKLESIDKLSPEAKIVYCNSGDCPTIYASGK